MISNKLVSVIIPIYNAEKHLHNSLNSVINQDYKNLEIILVNDGSTDNSVVECQKYIEKDKRIKLINQRNLGVSAARNNGFHYCNGEYICFVDSDDIIEKNMISNLIEILEYSNCDVACCNVHIIDKDKSEKFTNSNSQDVIYNSYDLLKNFLLGKVSHACWDKLYKRQILEEVDFPLKTTGEDRYFCWDLYKNINSMIVSPKVGYHYIRRTTNSITAQPLSLKNISRIEEALKVKNDIILHYPELFEEWEYYYYLGLKNLYNKFILQKVTKEDSLYKYFIFILKEINIIHRHENKYIEILDNENKQKKL